MFYVTNYQRNVRQDETNVPVFVAKKDIPAGTTGADSSGRACSRRPRSSAAASCPARSRIRIRSTSWSRRSRSSPASRFRRPFATPSQRGIRAQLTGVQRAIEIPGDQHELLAGTLKTGDKVDLVATFSVGGINGPPVSRIVLRNIEVLRAPFGAAGPRRSLPPKDGEFAAMLKVTDTQVQKLAWVFTTQRTGT